MFLVNAAQNMYKYFFQEENECLCPPHNVKIYKLIDLKKLYVSERKDIEYERLINEMFNQKPHMTNTIYNPTTRNILGIDDFTKSKTLLKHLITLEYLTGSSKVVLTRFQTSCLEKIFDNYNIDVPYSWYST